MRAVNLLPQDVQRSRRVVDPLPAAGSVAALLIVGLLLAGFLVEHGRVSAKKETLKRLQHDRAATAPPAPAPQAELIGDRASRVGALNAALGYRVAWDRIFRQLARVLPSDVWLTSLTAKAPTSPAGGEAAASDDEASRFSITGYTYSQDAVARLLTRLAVVPSLTEVRLESSGRTETGNRTVVQFTVLADLRAPGAS